MKFKRVTYKICSTLIIITRQYFSSTSVWEEPRAVTWRRISTTLPTGYNVFKKKRSVSIKSVRAYIFRPRNFILEKLFYRYTHMHAQRDIYKDIYYFHLVGGQKEKKTQKLKRPELGKLVNGYHKWFTYQHGILHSLLNKWDCSICSYASICALIRKIFTGKYHMK